VKFLFRPQLRRLPDVAKRSVWNPTRLTFEAGCWYDGTI
jgi:hypothetical protein